MLRPDLRQRRHLLAMIPFLAQIAWCVGSSPTAPAQDAGVSIDDVLKEIGTKYRFREVYSLKDAEAAAGEIAQTRNAFRETLGMTIDSPKGAPIKSERTRQLIYSERPAILAANNRVDAVVRRFETFRFDPAPQGIDAEKKKPLEGLTIYVFRGPESENVLSLTENRQLTDLEYQVATSVPTILNNAELLPTIPLRIGDSWPLSRTAARSLVGRGKVSSATLAGKLLSIDPVGQDAAKYSALISVSGQVVTDMGTCSLNLQYQFEFSKQAAVIENPSTIGNRESATVLAVTGGIRKLSLAQVEISDLQGSQGRLKQVFDRKLVFERQLSGTQTPIEVPAAVPTPTKENSWLVFEDSENRFRMIHPPVFKPRVEDESSIMFVTTAPIPEFVRVDLDAKNIKPEGLRKDFEKEWTAEGFEIFAVSEDYQEGWGDDRRVYRVEAALQATDTGNKQRGHFDAYVMQFPQNQTILAEALTYNERSSQFRDLVEEMLKSIELSVETAPKAPPADAAPAAVQPPGAPAAAPNP